MDILIEDIVDKLVIEGLSPTLVQLGFSLAGKRRAFQKKGNKYKLELNIQTRKIHGQNSGYVEVCPGIIYEEVEKLVAELKGEKPKKGWPTAAANIGNLKPKREFVEWPLTATTDILALGEVISRNIKDYALPFWVKFSTIEGLVDGYEKEDPQLTLSGNSYKWRMIAAYCIIGKYAEAINILEQWEKGRPPQVALQHAIDIILKS